jgi:hypothetical protein
LVSPDLEHALRDLLRLELRLCEVSTATSAQRVKASVQHRPQLIV